MNDADIESAVAKLRAKLRKRFPDWTDEKRLAWLDRAIDYLTIEGQY